ncbi:MAG: diguanylate cyclase, partial [Clostridiales bacterium]
MDYSNLLLKNKFKLISLIEESSISCIWLAQNIENNKDVLVKILKKNFISKRIDDIIRFKNEINIVSNLNSKNIVKIIDLGEIDETYYIVMEYLKLHSLQKLFEKHKKFSINESLELVSSFCEALSIIHKNDILHRNLNPGNIIIENTNYSNAKLIDSGTAQIRESDIRNKTKMLDLLYYISPEQSGLIRRSVDERSDLYSLGIIFYQLLTNKLPFTGDTINSIMHQHIATIPTYPLIYNPSIPKILAEIVMKLLEKESDKRYQSAEGLKEDIKKFTQGEKSFLLGLNEKFIRINFNSTFIGRENEINTLYNFYDDAEKSRGVICFISGEAGKGKTRLAEELRNYVLKKNGVFVKGKAFSGLNKIPFNILKDITNNYIKIFNGFDKNKKNLIRKNISEEIENFGKLILSLNPNLEKITGPCSNVVELDPEKEAARFQITLSKFFYALSKTNGTLVIMLDDLQWADSGTIDILKELQSQICDYPLLIIGTYRDNEITENHILKKFIDHSIEENISLYQINLQPFDITKMTQFISNLLHSNNKNIQEISKFILKKSMGNPFFSMEILKHLIYEKAVVNVNNTWKIEKKILENIDISESIVDILLKRISKIDSDESLILSNAAILGNKFDIEILSEITNINKENILNVVDKAVKMQLLEQDIDEYGKIIFAHDRIKEAFYKLMEITEKKATHLRIAKIIEKYNLKNITKVIYELAYHYIEADDTPNILKYAYPAGEKALKEYAYDSALKYFLNVKKILESENLKGSNFWINCTQNVGQSAAIIGSYDLAVNLFKSILEYDIEKIKIVQIHMSITQTYYKSGDWDNCYEYGRKGLILLGEKFPQNKYLLYFGIFKEFIVHEIQKFFLNSVYTKKKIKNPSDKDILACEIMEYLIQGAIANSLVKSSYLQYRTLNIAERKLGWSRLLAMSLMGYGAMMMSLSMFKKSQYYFDKSITMKNEIDQYIDFAKWCQTIGFLYQWNGDYKKCEEYFNKSVELYKKIGDIKEIYFSLYGLINLAMYRGNFITYNRLSNEYQIFANKTNSIYFKTVMNSNFIYYYKENGFFEKAKVLCEINFKLLKKSNNLANYCANLNNYGEICLMMNDSKTALEYLKKSYQLSKNESFLKQYHLTIYNLLAEAYIFDYIENQNLISKKEMLKKLKEIQKTCLIAIKKTKNWPAHYGISLRNYAKYLSVAGRYNKACEIFKESISNLKKYDITHELAKSLLEYGIFLKTNTSINKLKKSEFEKIIFKSYNIFKASNVKYYIKKCEDELSISDDSNEDSSTRFSKFARYSQRISSMIMVSHKISSILNLDILLDNVMETALEVTGAQNGFLFIKDLSDNFEIVSSRNSSENNIENDEFINTIITGVLNTGKSYLSDNSMEDNSLNSDFKNIILQKSILCVPIKYNNDITGICYLENTLSKSVFADDDIDILTIIMSQAAISIQNANLYKMAITDGLTQLCNHNQFKLLLKNELKNLSLKNDTLSVIVFDIDNFKKFNDTYGHKVGDEVLINVADITKKTCRKSDILARYGGEEFAIILKNTNLDGAFIVAEKIRTSIEEHEVIFNEIKLSVTVSIGISTYPLDGINPDELFKKADEAMYNSKNNGKNLVST